MFKKFYLGFILTLVICSCNKHHKRDLIGSWEFYLINNEIADIQYFDFGRDSVAFVDNFLFKQKGIYELNEDELYIKTTQGYEIVLHIQKLQKDTLQFAENETYFRQPRNNHYEPYELIGINTGIKLVTERVYSLIHLYKNTEGITKVRISDKRATYEEIPYFLAPAHTSSPEVLLFIGKGITLTDVRQAYLQIAVARHRKVILAVNNSGVNEYEIFTDIIPIWPDEVAEYSKSINMPQTPPVIKELRKDYWEKNAVKIEMNSINDLEKLSRSTNDKMYLISINHDLSIEDYLKIKQELFTLQRENIIELKTEIK